MKDKSQQFEKDLLALANACLAELCVNSDFGYGIQQDAKRPFGNSGQRALIDTLEQIGIILDDDIGDDELEQWLDYARELWSNLTEFMSKHCTLIKKNSNGS